MNDEITRRALLTGLVSGGAAVVLGGCASAVQTARRDARGDGRAGGVLVIGSLTDIDPKTIFTQSITTMTIGTLVWDTLIRYDRRTLTPRPSVATDWTWSTDRRALRLTLRPDVVFHGGRPLTSADVAYAVERYASKTAGSQLRTTAQTITAVDTTDPHVAVLRLSQPVGNLFDLLEFMLLVDRESEAGLTRGDSFVGTGPFVVRDRQVGSGISMERFARYWRGPARLDGVRLRVVRDSGALLTSVRARQSDLVLDAAPASLRPFSDPTLWRVQTEDVLDVAYYVGANVTDSRLSDKRVRQAISWAIDRERIAREVFVGRARASSSPWAPTSPAYSHATTSAYRRDPDRARTLLTAAGWRGGPPLLLSYGNGLAVAGTIAAVVQNDLAQVGIDTILDPREQATLSPFLSSGDHQLWINPHGFGQSSPATLATGAAPFRPTGNLSRFTSTEYTAAVQRVAAVDPDTPQARAAYDAFTAILLDQQFVIDLAITSSTNVSGVSVRDLDWNIYKYIDLHGTTAR